MQPNFEIAHHIAADLSNTGTDHNELAKASAYLNQLDKRDDFFEWLKQMATPYISEKLARSRRTPVYYQQIRDSCEKLRPITNVKEMALTLAWAVRLLRYYPRAKVVTPEQAVVAPLQRRIAPVEQPQPRLSTTPEIAPAKAVAPTPPVRLVAVQLSSVEEATPGALAKGSVRLIENNRLLIDLGIGEDASITFDRLPGKPNDPDEVAERYPAGSSIEVRLLERNKKNKLQATIAE